MINSILRFIVYWGERLKGSHEEALWVLWRLDELEQKKVGDAEAVRMVAEERKNKPWEIPQNRAALRNGKWSDSFGWDQF